MIGGPPPDFAALDPQVQAVFGQVQQQLTAEGWSGPDIENSQQTYADAYKQLAPYGQQLGGWQAIANSAAQYVGLSSTIQGAQSIIGGLVLATQSGSGSTGIINAFTGVSIAAIGTAIAVGAVSAGVGALIVGGVELIGSLVGGLFGSPAPTVAQVGGCPLTYRPGYVIPGAFVWAVGDSNGGGFNVVKGGPSRASWSLWRHMPDPNDSNDAEWFKYRSNSSYNTPGGYADPTNPIALNFTFEPNQGGCSWWWTSPSGSAQHDHWVACISGTAEIKRAVDQAFLENPNGPPGMGSGSSVYHQLECDNAGLWVLAMAGANIVEGMPALQKFQQAFWAAWKANREYELNGLARQADWQVLHQVVVRWNMAHEPGVGLSITPAAFAPIDDAYNSPCEFSPYFQMLITGILSNESSVSIGYDPSTGRGVIDTSGGLHLNTGPLKNVGGLGGVGIICPPGYVWKAGLCAPATPPASMSAGAKVAVGLGVGAAAGVAGLVLYAYLTGQTLEQASRKVLAKTVAGAKGIPQTAKAGTSRAVQVLPRVR